jgi:hypothetical protein
MDNELEEGLGDTFDRVKNWIKSYAGAGAKPTVAGASTVDQNAPVPMFTGKDPLQQRLMNSLKTRIVQFGLGKNETNIILAEFEKQILELLKDLAAQMKANGLTQKQIQEAMIGPQMPTGMGGRVQAKPGQIDVRRAVFGKFERAMKNLDNMKGVGGKFRAKVDMNTRKKFIEDVVQNNIIPFLTQHLTSKGFNVVDKKNNKTVPSKVEPDKAKTVTLSESTVNRWKEIAGIIKD